MASRGPEYAGGLANHGPMTAEALVSMGRPDAVARWVDAYSSHLEDKPASRQPVQQAAWQEALGRFEQAGDLREFFNRQLAESSWPSVIGIWAPRLAPGLAGVAMHGIIRAGHAARALSIRHSPARLHELAEGLAYWAARYQRLPEAATRARGSLPPSAAPGSVARLPAGQQRRGIFITARLEQLESFPPFLEVADLVDTSGDASVFIGDLAATMAEHFITQAHNPGVVIALIHAVTGPASIRPLLPFVDRRKRGPAAPRLAGGSGDCCYAHRPGASPRNSQPAAGRARGPSRPQRRRARDQVHRGCLREHTRSPRPEFLAAAAEAVPRLSR